MNTTKVDYITQQMTSKLTNYLYTINIYVPEEEAPQDGFPVLYVLDGSSYFNLVKEAVRLQCRNAPKQVSFQLLLLELVMATICVKEDFMILQHLAESYIYPARFKGKGHEKLGGAVDFSRFIEEELKPTIEAQYPVNQAQQALFGHSLGGYFALWQLFHHQSSFQRYLAISPSIWWNEHELVQCASVFLNEHQDMNETLFLSGELETFMVDDARQMATVLEK